MILKAKERGGGAQLARYLLTMNENEHVSLHELRGFASDTLLDAFREVDAISKGTRCQKYLFSMSLNPPGDAVTNEAMFEKTADAIERKLGLEGQPRAIVFHDKDGRRHAHVVWSRIDSERMRAINLPHYKRKLKDVSRELFLEHGWTMPRGLVKTRERDPLNFSHAEWQQAKRVKLDPRHIKQIFQDCWKRSDSKAAFMHALEENGFTLARGDRRGYVAIDYRGEVYSITRYAGVRTKEVASKLGSHGDLLPAQEKKSQIAARMTNKLQEFVREAEREAERGRKVLEFKRGEMVGRHRQSRALLRQKQERRWQAEENARTRRLPSGISGIWHRLTGQYGKVKERNELEAWQALKRDSAERDTLVLHQAEERRQLQQQIRSQNNRLSMDLLRLRKDISHYDDMRLQGREPLAQDRKRQANKAVHQRQRRSHGPQPD
ncbi:relaxase/mobilization nuclease domain-containing protein [Sneathiella sp.]|uniref:relaxase/mobilization nuclease domain-containing protein n=1 Tax=Sneathiella sp. TaxID=1964365 RepID=UPI002610A575|nr:relaxase/mobilization nuclease domain-containing protein [Sneathiella sp.]MDF2365643.1 relaxase/mobilization nuclease domain-containing protein [Sneathiella sp.]